MYEELVKRMRQQHQDMDCGNCNTCVILKAADAIEKLSRECKVLYAMLGTHPDPRGELGDPGMPLPEPPKEEELCQQSE